MYTWQTEVDMTIVPVTAEQIIVFSLADWQGFDVGESDDFEQEVQQTAQNTQLLAFLAERKNAGKRVPIAHIQKLLGHS
jgi:acetyl-CoA carboxylase carboxyltransferase component